MADGLIQVPADSTGKKVDTSELTVGVNTVERQRIVLADDAAAAALAKIQNAAPGASDYGLTVRPIPSGTQNVRPSDGTNPITQTFDVDSGAGAQFVEGVSLRKAAGGGSVELGTSADPIRNDPTGTTAQPVTQTTATSLKAEVVGPTADNAANPTAKLSVLAGVANAAAPTRTEGNVVPLRTNLAGDVAVTLDGELVDVSDRAARLLGVAKIVDTGGTNQLAVTAANAAKVDGSGVTQPVSIAAAVDVSDRAARLVGQVEGRAAQGSAVAGNPNLQGGEARTTNPTAVADGQTVRALRDKLGRAVVVPGHIRDLVVDSGAITLSTTGETTIIAAGAAGVFHDLTLLIITNTSATATRVDIRDATAGTVRFSVAIAANGGIAVPIPIPVKQTTAANNWTAQLGTAVTDIRIFAQAVKNL